MERTNKKKKMSKEKQIVELGRQARESFACNFTNENAENNNDNIFEQSETIEIVEIPCDGRDIDHNYCAELNDSVPSAPPSTGVPDSLSVPVNVQTNSDTGKRHVLRPLIRRNNKSNTLRKDVLSYLAEKNERENTLKNREIELQTRKLLLEERRFLLEEKKVEWEITERKEKLEIEKTELEMMISDKNSTELLLQTQQQLIESLMKQLRNE